MIRSRVEQHPAAACICRMPKARTKSAALLAALAARNRLMAQVVPAKIRKLIVSHDVAPGMTDCSRRFDRQQALVVRAGIYRQPMSE
jgi:hypothetical protein